MNSEKLQKDLEVTIAQNIAQQKLIIQLKADISGLRAALALKKDVIEDFENKEIITKFFFNTIRSWVCAYYGQGVFDAIINEAVDECIKNEYNKENMNYEFSFVKEG